MAGCGAREAGPAGACESVLRWPVEPLEADSDVNWDHVVQRPRPQFIGARCCSSPDKTGRRPRLLFPSCAAIADKSLAAAVADAGPSYAGCEWTWREAPVCFADASGKASVERRAVACSGGEAVGIAAASCTIPAAAGPASHAELGALTCAFQCGECPDAAFAERQCACCGVLLCLECANRCEYDGLRNPRLDPEFSRTLSSRLRAYAPLDRQRCAKALESLSLGNEVAHAAPSHFARTATNPSLSLRDGRPATTCSTWMAASLA